MLTQRPRSKGAVSVSLPAKLDKQDLRIEYIAPLNYWQLAAFWTAYLAFLVILVATFPLLTIPGAWVGKRVSKRLRKLGAKTVVEATKDGISLSKKGSVAWRVSWEDIESIQTHPKSQTTSLETRSGNRLSLPFAMGNDASFRADRNALYLLLRSKQNPEAYARPTAPPNFWKDYRDYPADHGAFWFLAWIMVQIGAVALFGPFSFLGGLDASNIVTCLVLMLAMGMLGAIPTGKKMNDADTEADWWRRLGPADSLYRQLNQVSVPAYGTYRYGTEFKEAEEKTSEVINQFNVNWRRQPPVLFEKIREVYWSAEGVSFTKGGPICQVAMDEVPDDLRAGKVHMYVTDDDGTAVFDPRYLRLVEHE